VIGVGFVGVDAWYTRTRSCVEGIDADEINVVSDENQPAFIQDAKNSERLQSSCYFCISRNQPPHSTPT
jgi:hypothetical protein